MFGAVVVSVLLSRCSLLVSLDDLQPADATSTDTATNVDAGADAQTTDAEAGTDAAESDGCPDGGGPVMVPVQSACIDSTEVTCGQYAAFLATGPLLSSQPAVCAWNTSFVPALGWPCTDENLPVANVNWCHAYSFCAWAGKHLCGGVGGGPVADGGVIVATEDAWFLACTHGGTRLFPYGNAYDAGACNGVDRDAGGPVDVASLPGCEGGYTGLFDMSGNVVEWQDACISSDAGAAHDLCVAGGGSYANLHILETGEEQAECQNFDTVARNAPAPHRGFRCCAP
jgi:formylglycine-generating enzyme required for sulfatase activity